MSVRRKKTKKPVSSLGRKTIKRNVNSKANSKNQSKDAILARNKEILSMLEKHSASDVAKKFGLTRSRVWQIKTGPRKPRGPVGRPFASSPFPGTWLAKLGKGLRQARAKSGLTLSEVSNLTRRKGKYVEITRLSKIERGLACPTVKEVLCLASICGVDVADIWPKSNGKNGLALILNLPPREGIKLAMKLGYPSKIAKGIYQR